MIVLKIMQFSSTEYVTNNRATFVQFHIPPHLNQSISMYRERPLELLI